MKRFVRHPTFPLIVFLFVCQVTGEFYPFSAFSMYSNPSPRPMRLYYLADAEGNPMPLTPHTGSSPARITKTFNHHKGTLGERESPPPDAEIRRYAGEKVLTQLRELSMNRSKKRRLVDPIQLIELSITVEEGELVETHKPVARLEAARKE